MPENNTPFVPEEVTAQAVALIDTAAPPAVKPFVPTVMTIVFYEKQDENGAITEHMKVTAEVDETNRDADGMVTLNSSTFFVGQTVRKLWESGLLHNLAPIIRKAHAYDESVAAQQK